VSRTYRRQDNFFAVIVTFFAGASAKADAGPTDSRVTLTLPNPGVGRTLVDRKARPGIDISDKQVIDQEG